MKSLCDDNGVASDEEQHTKKLFKREACPRTAEIRERALENLDP
jgi:hypothetical protein